MSAKQKETASVAGDWLYKGIAIYFLWNIYTDVQRTNNSSAVYQERLDRHEIRLNNIEQSLFAPVWKRDEKKREVSEKHAKDSKFLWEYTQENLADLNRLAESADSVLSKSNTN